MNAMPNMSKTLANLSPAELYKRAPAACQAAAVTSVTVMAVRYQGVAVDDAKRDELLAKCAAGQHVEIELDLLAYEQETGVRNRNNVRLRDGAMMNIGRSGVKTPFLRDHEQRDVMARAGTIIASQTEKRDEGSYAIKQTARVTAPWAVDLALRGLLDTVSIGWRPTGPVMCSACNAAIFTKCWHCPGDRLAEVDDEGGGKRKVRKADGSIVVEWIFTEAELIETSLVSVPAVPGAHIEGIRAALASEGLEFESSSTLHEEISMQKLAVIAATLGLAATAGEDEVISAAEAMKRELATKKSELAIAEAENVKLSAENETFKAAEAKAAEEKFIKDAISSGRITLGDVDAWRDLYQLDAKRATERMATRKAGQAMPVGVRQQTPKEEPGDKDPGAPGAGAKAAFEANGVNFNQSMKFARMFGAKNPEKTAAAELGLGGEDE